MNQEMLNQQKRVQTSSVSLDGFIVKETLAGHLVPNAKRNNNFGSAELKNIQKKRRGATIRLYNRYY